MNTQPLRAAALIIPFVLLGALAGCQGEPPASAAATQAENTKRPDLSGFWNLAPPMPVDPELMEKVTPGAVFLWDTGATEFPRGEYGGLKVKPEALAKAQTWDPRADLTPERACIPPSVVYAMQGPFPIEIFQGTEFIVMKLEYYDLVRIIFMDGRKPEADHPHSKTGFSVGHWEGDILVVETTHLAASTIANNGLDHTENIRMIERFKLSEDGSMLMATQEYFDPEVIDGVGARFIVWRKEPGEHVYPYECDPGFAGNYTLTR